MKSFKEYITEAKSETYTIPWSEELNSEIKALEKKYKVKIKQDGTEADVSGKRENLKKFFLDIDIDDDLYRSFGFPLALEKD